MEETQPGTNKRTRTDELIDEANKHPRINDTGFFQRPKPQKTNSIIQSPINNENVRVHCGIIQLLEYNNHKPIDNEPIRDIRNITPSRSHIVIEIVGHGALLDMPPGKMDTLDIRDVSIFSLSPYAECVAASEAICERNRNQITDALKQNYPIIPTFSAFRTYATNPQCDIYSGNLKLAIDNFSTDRIGAILNNELAYFHLFEEDTEYVSDPYDMNSNTDYKDRKIGGKDVIVRIFDIRYPKNRVQQGLLSQTAQQFTQYLHSSKIIKTVQVNNKDATKNVKDVMFLSDLIRYLKNTFKFDAITIFEMACRVHKTQKQLDRDSKNVYHETSRRKYEDYKHSDPNIMLQGGRRKRRTRRIKSITVQAIVSNRVSGIRRRTRKRRTHRRKHRNIKQISP